MWRTPRCQSASTTALAIAGGAPTVGDSPTQAFMRLETVEQNARIRFMLAQLGAGGPLDAYEVGRLLQMRRRMGLEREGEAAELQHRWGVSSDGLRR